ncbi:MAG TPA: TM2 domain-containing protein [Cytophagaceae bacterium]|jgi:hypothetical protein|nr:TM2 domain-containing protein [Cytophagaceae bacterium]
MESKNRKYTQILLISFFLGFLGVDRYLMGYKNWWLKTITLGGCCVWALIDLINIATFKMKMADGRALE